MRVLIIVLITVLNSSYGAALSKLKSQRFNLPLVAHGKYEIYTLKKLTGLEREGNFLKRFYEVLITDRKNFDVHLNKKQRIVLDELIVRVGILKDGGYKESFVRSIENEKHELLIQIVELARLHELLVHHLPYYMDKRPRPNHPFFYGKGHAYWNAFSLRIRASRPYGKALNLVDSDQPIDQRDPRNSVFWNRRKKAEETYHYGKKRDELCSKERIYFFKERKNIPEYGGGRNPGVKLYTYFDDPKKGRDKDSYSAKFAMKYQNSKGALFHKQEAYIETGLNGLYKAMGYNTDKGYYCDSIVMRFHPKLFNLSESKLIQLNIFDLRLYYKSLILVDGSEVAFEDAVDVYRYMDHSKINKINIYGSPVESYVIKEQYVGKIEFIRTYGIYLEKRSKKYTRVFSWNRTGLSHQDRREIRALLLIDSWFGNVDNFGFNLKVVFKNVSDKTKPRKMSFVLVDSGDSLAPHDLQVDYLIEGGYLPLELREALKASKFELFNELSEPYKNLSDIEVQINRFGWSIFGDSSESKTLGSFESEEKAIEKVRDDLILFRSLRLEKLTPYLTIDDLKWTTRLIAGLTEKQILHSFSTSGIGYAGAVLVTEKLISRRDQLVRYFGLDGEIPLLRPAGANKELNVKGDGHIRIEKKSKSKKVLIPSYGHSVEKGTFKTAK
ncbi:MAG: hypothetical protein HOE90_05065 [Bacteriovoracaceae bacterium]|jgi:hypothetical protein|nr:hypothetical protein [Bacteriovoracaceae bacterium]